MADRRRQIELLISSRFDYLWFPPSNLKTSSGLVPAKREDCPDCGTTDHPGWQVDSFKRRTPCETCGGRVVDGKPKRGKGRVAVDPMDSHRRVVGATDTASSAHPRKRVKCDRCQDIAGEATGVLGNAPCPSCGGTGKRDLHVFDLRLDTAGDETGVDALTASIARRDQAGSYHELDLALAGISRHVNKPPKFRLLTLNASLARRLLDDLFLHHEQPDLAPLHQALVDLALEYIDGRMPDPIRVPADVTANRRIRLNRPQWPKGSALTVIERQRRDKQVRLWAKDGKPYPWIREQTGLSDRQLREIINGKGVAA